MKKLFLISAIGISVTALMAFTQFKSSEISKIENLDCSYGRCQKIKDNGYQCKACAQQYSSYCWSHRD
jgi:hypothetical protein